jgi:hypothetical protein
MRTPVRPYGASAAALALLAVDMLVRAVVGGPYVGATLLVLAACGLSLLPVLPATLRPPSRQLAVLPALSLGSLSILLSTISIVGIRLTEVTIRLAAVVLVVALAAATTLLRSRGDDDPGPACSLRREALTVALLALLFVFSYASSLDIARPFRAETDLGHYLLYADEVEAQGRLLIDDPFAGEPDRIFADPQAVGAIYGTFLILDGISSWPLAHGLLVVSALSVLSVFAAAAALWGTGAGLAAAGAYAVAPIRLDPMYWHGLGTSLALVYVPLVVLALGLMFRGQGGWRASGLLGLSLVGVAASHSTSAVVIGALILLAPLLDGLRWLVVRRHWAGAARSWWRDGIARPLGAGLVVAVVLGAGVGAHLAGQAADLGSPVDYRIFDPDWIDREAIRGYFSWEFLVLAAVALVVLLASRSLRRDSALLAVGALALACVVVSQLWRVEFAFEYRRVVYYVGIALVLVIGAAAVRLPRRLPWIAGYVVVLAFVAHVSVGLRLPERLVSPDPEPVSAAGLVELRRKLDSGQLPDTPLIVVDNCLKFAVPYYVRRPTIAAITERELGFENRLPLARKAVRIIEGGPQGRRLAQSMGVRYVIANAACIPDLATRLDGTVVLENAELVVVQLPVASQ